VQWMHFWFQIALFLVGAASLVKELCIGGSP
jgi:hypothetical protein